METPTPAPRAGGACADRELVERCLAGDADAWGALVDRYERLIYAVPLRAGLPPEDAADVFQTVCLELYVRLGSVRDPARLAAFVATIARRESWLAIRRRRATRASSREESEGAGSVPELADAAPLPDEVFLELERASVLRAALGELSERCRALLTALLADDGSASYDDVARRLAVPRGSLGPTRARCVAKLRALLGERGVSL